MIKLKNIVVETWGQFFKAWWMDPDGKLHQVYTDNPQYGHFNWARDYLKKSNIHWTIDNEESPGQVLLKRGWIRITFNYYRDSILHFDYYSGKLPSNKQAREIKNLAIESEAKGLFNDTDNVEVELFEGR